MPSYFCLSITLLDGAFHGRRDDGVPEWPPSPLRAFQALVAAAAARWRGPQIKTHDGPALEWLEGLEPPDILTPISRTAPLPYRLYVPNNAGDLVARAWAGGNAAATIAEHRTEKDVRPTRMIGGDAFKEGSNMVRFVWRLPTTTSAEVDELVGRLSAAARSITHLGWGVDMVAGHASVVDEQTIAGTTGDQQVERWTPGPGGTPLRVPQAKSDQGPSTFYSLLHRHDAFTRRMTGGKPQDVPPLTAFAVAGYRRATDPPSRPFAAFSVLKPDASGFRPFNAARHATVVAGMVRHALATAAKDQRPFGWTDAEIASIVLGHASEGGPARMSSDAKRFSYLPLPSIERRGSNGEHVGMIRRVIVSGRPGMAEEVAWLRRALSGADLVDEATGEAKALLALIPSNDPAIRRYVTASAEWATVTPVVVPGLDDRRGAKMERLLRKALEQAAFSRELTDNAVLEWRGVGFLPGIELAGRYRRPLNTREAPVRHVKIQWRDAAGQPVSVPGPLAVGSGRFRGLGLFLPTIR